MSTDPITLDEVWRLRNAAAATLALCETQMNRTIQSASIDDLISLIETFSPARSTGPEWTRTFEPLVERLWAWCDEATIGRLALAFRARGLPWTAVANALSPEYGAKLSASARHPAGARFPAFVVV